MRLTGNKLKNIIKEEINKFLSEINDKRFYIWEVRESEAGPIFRDEKTSFKNVGKKTRPGYETEEELRSHAKERGLIWREDPSFEFGGYYEDPVEDYLFFIEIN